MYYFVFGIFYLLSLLPWRILYLLSDLAFFVIYHVLGYRKKVVAANLLNAFPEKTEEERKKIAKQSYRNFCDNWIETVKLISVSKENLLKHFSGEPAIIDDFYATGKSMQGNFGHFFNWEMLNHYFSIRLPYTIIGIYFPQKSKVMDRILKYMRARFGIVLIPLPDMARQIIPWRKKQYFIALIGDQSPAVPSASYWLYFMNRPACFVKGPEKYARGQKIPVSFTYTTRVKRGYYHFDTVLLTDEPVSLPEGELMRRYVHHLEENIRRQPASYMWTHKRWKHAWKPEYKDLWVDTLPLPDVK